MTATDSHPGRLRDQRLDAAILRADAELIVEIGYPNLAMAGVAESAGSTESALYGRWLGKAGSVAANDWVKRIADILAYGVLARTCGADA